MKQLLFILFTSIVVSSNNYESIYNLSSNARNAAMGGIHISSNSISSLFDAPLSFDLENLYDNDVLFSFNNQYNNNIEVMHFAYCIYSSEKNKLGFGLVNRLIDNNFNTSYAWQDNGDGIPTQDEIDYNQIFKFKDQEIGLLISYNHYLNEKSAFAINIKPLYHSIGGLSATGFGFDALYTRKTNLGNASLILSDLWSTKKWDFGIVEKLEPTVYLNSEFNYGKIILCIEFDSNSNGYGGIEYSVNRLINLRMGSNKSYTSLGVGLNLNLITFDYVYMHNNYLLGNSHMLSFAFDIKQFSQ